MPPPEGSLRPRLCLEPAPSPFSPRPTSTTSGSCTWRASSWPTTPRHCPYWPSTLSRTGRPPGRSPLLHRTPVHCSLSGPSSRGTCSQLGTPATCRCRCPVLGAPPSCGRSAGPADSGDEDPSADVTWAPAVPGPGPCATPRSGRSAGSRTGCLTWGLPSQVGPGRALQVQVQPPRRPARRRRQVVGPQEARALLPPGQPPRPEGLLPVAGVAVPRTAVGAAPGLRADQ